VTTPSTPRAANRLLFLALLLSTAPVAAADVAAGAAAASPLEPTLVEVTVNGEPADEPLMLQRDSAGGIYASEAQLREWRIRLPSAAPVTVDGEAWYRIDTDPRLGAIFSAADQTLAIAAQPDLFETQSASLVSADAFEMTPSGNGGFFNYDVFAEYSDGGIALTGALEAGAFTRWGVGTTGIVARAGAGGNRFVRLDSSWTVDRPGSVSSIRIGDSVTVGGTGAAPVRFGGVQYARNFATRPGYLTMPLPALQGSAAVPSVVDIYVNNQLQGSRDVRPGPFELTNVPVQSGGGTVQLVVRDALGRQVVSEQSYYASSILLRRGLHDFSYEIGFLRAGFGTRSMDYGTAIATTSHRYGLSDSLTIEGHAQVSRALQGAGAGLVFSLAELGMVGGSASISRSERGTGAFFSGSFERRSTGLSFGLRGEYATANFSSLGMSEANRPARFSSQAFADLPSSADRSASTSSTATAGRERTKAWPASSPTCRWSTMPASSSSRAAPWSGEQRTVVGAHVSFALGGRRSASANVEMRSGSISHQLSIQDDAPVGVGGGYRASTSLAGGRRTIDSVYTYNAPQATLGAHASRAGGEMGMRLSARGALGLVGGRPFASRQLGTSFARVQVGSQAGVRVYADNQLIGVTGEDGSLVVPSLRAFDRNVIRIDDADLPLDVQIAETEIAVRPFARAGALVRFDVRRERGVLIQVRLEDGSALPAGALVRIAGRADMYVAASGGEVYVPDLAGAATFEASWGGGRCSFEARVPETGDPQPRLAGLVCRAAPTYAAR
jgi:outer membrane usher protein